MKAAKKKIRLLLSLLIALLGGIWLPFDAFAQKPVTTVRPAAEPRRPPDLLIVHGRVSVAAPTKPLNLGEENALDVSLQGPPVLHFSMLQREATANGLSAWIEGGDDDLTVKRRADGSTYVNVVPQRLGRLEFRFNVMFSDGGFDQASVAADVVAVKPPEKLEVLPIFMGQPLMTMDLSERSRKEKLFITATYPGLQRPLAISPKAARFTVRMAKGEPVIRFDPATGEVDALRIGHALIEIGYGGLRQAMCVRVTENTGFLLDRSHCEELREGQETAMSSTEVADALFKKNRSTLPYMPMDGRRGRFLADERVTVVAPSGPLHVAEDNAIKLTIRGPAIARIECLTGGFPCVAWTGDWSRKGLALTRHTDGSASVSVFPTAFGHEMYTFFILFVDGGVALKKVNVDVDAGPVKPRAIARWCGSTSPYADMPVRLTAPKDGKLDFRGTAIIVPSACYDGARDFVTIPADLVAYTVRSEGRQPVVQLNPSTGKVTAIRQGQALIQQAFAGLRYDSCVVVEPPGPPFDDVSNCRDLRAKFGAALTPLQVNVRAPQRLGSAGPSGLGSAGPSVLLGQFGKTPEVDAITAATLSPHVRDTFNADARLTIPTAGVSAVLGEVTRLPIFLTGPPVLQVSIFQKLTRYLPAHASVEYDEPSSGVVNHDEAGRSYLGIIALRTGTTQFHVRVLFADGGVAKRMIRVPVKLPTDRKVKLLNGLEDTPYSPIFPATTLHLTTRAPTNTRALFPFLYFDQRSQRIALDPREVQFSVVNTSSQPVIQLDSATGTITALTIGHALVRSRYGAAETKTCVVVVRDIVESDPSNCEELRAGNRPIGPS